MSIQRFIESRPANRRSGALLAHAALDVGLDVGQEEVVGVPASLRQLGLELAEHAELRVVGVGLVQVVLVVRRSRRRSCRPRRARCRRCSPRGRAAPRTRRRRSRRRPGPTTRTSVKKLAASEKCTAAPPSIRSRSPNGRLDGVEGDGSDYNKAHRARARRIRFAARCARCRSREFGGPEVLRVVRGPRRPSPGDGELLIRVARAGVNFGDTHQRAGPVHRQARAAVRARRRGGGQVVDGGHGFEAGDRVVALLETGGYAECAVAPAAQTFAHPRRRCPTTPRWRC